MNDYLISQYIDNELDFDEKVEFVETVHQSLKFKTETIALLEQEKAMRDELEHWVPAKPPRLKTASGWKEYVRSWWQPLAGFATATALFAIMAPYFLSDLPLPQSDYEHRFVVYLPTVNEADIIGTFTNWKPLPMEKIGSSGYWTVTLRVQAGEHRYSYLVGNKELMADPTVPTRERDDFGGENSVISIRGSYVPVS